MSALSGAAGSPAGAGTRSMTATSKSSMPMPALALTFITSSGLVKTACSISPMTKSGRACGRSILFRVGTSFSPASIARNAFATVCACTPWKASTRRTAPSQAARLRETS